MNNTRDALRQNKMLLILLVVCLIVIGPAPWLRYYDDHLRPRPWIAAEVAIVPVAGADRPSVMYRTHTNGYIKARWVAYVERLIGNKFVRSCGSDGRGSYKPNGAMKGWDWADWLGRDCSVPLTPYRLCVFYDAETPRGATAQFGPFCSAVHDPRKESE